MIKGHEQILALNNGLRITWLINQRISDELIYNNYIFSITKFYKAHKSTLCSGPNFIKPVKAQKLAKRMTVLLSRNSLPATITLRVHWVTSAPRNNCLAKKKCRAVFCQTALWTWAQEASHSKTKRSENRTKLRNILLILICHQSFKI